MQAGYGLMSTLLKARVRMTARTGSDKAGGLGEAQATPGGGRLRVYWFGLEGTDQWRRCTGRLQSRLREAARLLVCLLQRPGLGINCILPFIGLEVPKGD